MSDFSEHSQKLNTNSKVFDILQNLKCPLFLNIKHNDYGKMAKATPRCKWKVSETLVSDKGGIATSFLINYNLI